MPFKSEKQRKWMHANEPEMAKKWEKEEAIREKLRNVIKQEIRSINEANIIQKIDKLAKADKYGTVDGTRMNGKTAREIMAMFKHPKMNSHRRQMMGMKSHELVDLTISLLKPLKIKVESINEWHKFRGKMTYGGRKNKDVEKYIKGIRNKSKKEYGRVYADWVSSGRRGASPKRHNLSVMGAQAVRMNIDDLLKESVILEWNKYHLGGLLDSKVKKRLERTIRVIGGKVDSVGDDYITFRIGGMDLKRLPSVIKKLDRNKNVWIGDKQKNNIWDRKRNIDKLHKEAFRPKGVSLMKKIVFLPKSKLYFDPDNGNFWLMGPYGGEPDWEEDPIEPKDRDYKRTLSRLSSKDKSIMKKSLRGKGNWKEATTTVSVPGYLTPVSFKKSTQKAIEFDDEDDEKRESVDEISMKMQPFSSPEARAQINSDIKDMSKHLGKASQQVIKIMMDGVRKGKYTAMDISRGIKEGPAQRTHFGEMTFIQSLWNKMREKFRRYSKDRKLS